MSALAHRSRTACLATVFTALFALPAVAQKSCELTLQAVVGERRLVTVESTVDATITSTDLEEKKTSRSIFTQRKETFAEETVVVDDRKDPIQIRLNCLTATVEERTAGETTGGLRKSPLQGRIVTVTREGKGWTVIPLGGVPLEADVADSLGRWLDLPLLLKSGKVKPGDSWAVQGADRLVSIGLGKETGVPEVRCTLSRILPGKPSRAEVTLSIRMNHGGEGKASRLAGQLTGLLLVDLAAKKPLSLALSGRFQASRDVLDASGLKIGRIDIQARQIQLKMRFEAARAKK